MKYNCIKMPVNIDKENSVLESLINIAIAAFLTCLFVVVLCAFVSKKNTIIQNQEIIIKQNTEILALLKK